MEKMTALYNRPERSTFGLKDTAVKEIFTNEKNKEYLSEILSKILVKEKLTKDYIMDHLEFVPPEITKNVNEKKATLDSLYNLDALIINIEYNGFKSSKVINKNLRYVFKLYVDSFKIGTENSQKTIQINFDCYDLFGYNDLIYEIGLCDKKHFKLLSTDMTIYSVNLAKLNEMDYTKIKKKGKNSLEYFAYILVSKGSSEFEKMYKDNGIMKRMVNKMKNMCKDTLKDLYYDKEALDAAVLHDIAYTEGFDKGEKTGFEKGEKTGYEKGEKTGFEKGIELKNLKLIKVMLERNESKEKIIDYTELTEEEYNEYLKKIA